MGRGNAALMHACQASTRRRATTLKVAMSSHLITVSSPSIPYPFSSYPSIYQAYPSIYQAYLSIHQAYTPILHPSSLTAKIPTSPMTPCFRASHVGYSSSAVPESNCLVRKVLDLRFSYVLSTS